MAALFFVVALILQSSLIFAHNEEETTRDVLKNKIDIDDEVIKDCHGAKLDWIDMFMIPEGTLHPTSSAALMSQVTSTDKTLEEQLEDIKEMANKITLAIQSEMANLLSYALINAEKDESNNLRKKRSAESPLDSSHLIMRLLKHIKSNNEYQNIAIEKMMTAQEIADKYGIAFSPDTEILSDLAVAANKHTEELTDILQDAGDLKNVTQEHVQFIPFEDEYCPINPENDTYYAYSVQQEKPDVVNAFPSYEYAPEQINFQPSTNHVHNPHVHYNHHHHAQGNPAMAPVYQPPVTPRPNYLDSMLAVTPVPEFYPFYPEPVTTTTTIIFPIEEPVEPEPILVGEEFEETISSKVTVDHDEEPGSSTVNHVMTYTLSEKSHFRTPQIEKLPQQMQYTFFLM